MQSQQFQDSQTANTPKINIRQLKNRIKKHLKLAKKTLHNIEVYIQKTINEDVEDETKGVQKYNKGRDYYKMYFDTYSENEKYLNHLENIQAQLTKLREVIQQADVRIFLNKTKTKGNKKHRRMAAQIQKDFECPYQNCYKVYGSDVSLNLHIKIKHGGGNKSDRDKLAHQICLAQKSGNDIPLMNVVLPPHFLEQYRRKFSSETQ